MRLARESRGVSLGQIADTTKLSKAALEALERNDISRLPGGIFSRAFVRSYASEIGMDPEETVRDFLIQFPDDLPVAAHARPAFDSPTSDTHSRAGVIAMVCVVALVVAAAVIYFLPRP